MGSLMNRIRDIMERYNLYFHRREGEELETIDLFYGLFLFSAVLFCVVTFFVPSEHVLFVPPLYLSVIVMPPSSALAIIVYVIIFHKTVFNFKR